MTDVEVTKGESVDRALKRLKNKLEAEGIMDEMRRLRAFETPVQRYRRKQRTAAKKSRSKLLHLNRRAHVHTHAHAHGHAHAHLPEND